MKKFTKIFLVAVATLAMALSFTGCEALLGAFFGDTMTMKVEPTSYAKNGTKVIVQFQKFKMTTNDDGEYPSDGGPYTVDFTVGDSAKAMKDYLGAFKIYTVKIVKIGSNNVNIPVLAADSMPATYVGDTKTPDEKIYFECAGNYDYVIQVTSDSIATMSCSMQTN